MHTPLPIDFFPKKVISLVPSMTESMFELDLGQWMVACTDYCAYPINGTNRLARVGGPKNINTALILELKPDLVIANLEENRIEEIDLLTEKNINVWEAYPTSVRETLDDLWGIAGLFQSDHAARVLRSLEDSLEWVKATTEDAVKKKYFCPIWIDRNDGAHPIEWMTFNQNTYMNDLLSLFGGTNVFGMKERENVVDEKQKRYPLVNAGQIIEARPDIVILPDEPYVFKETDLQEFKRLFTETGVQPMPKFVKAEGSLIMWHGTRLAKALCQLPELFQ